MFSLKQNSVQFRWNGYAVLTEFAILAFTLNQVDVTFDGDTVWLNQDQMASLFQKAKSTINEHIKHIYEDGELEKTMTMKKFGNTELSTKPTNYYNLDMIISVGYRVRSQRGVQFRIWASSVLKEYLKKGFAMNDERLKGNGGGVYWKELLDRIRDIRSSEKVLYRQVLDLYATSVDYDPKSNESVEFFKIVQNKLHYAAHGHTAAEVIFERADADKPFMGLKTFAGEMPVLKDVSVAKNYLDETELKIMNNLVSGYFDIAEISAIEHKPMYMRDYIEQLDSVLSSGVRQLLSGSGMVPHSKAVEKAGEEYRKYQEETLSPVEVAYLETVRETGKKAQKEAIKSDK